MTGANVKEYVFGRDKEESARLDEQHEFLVKLTDDHVIHPSIPKDQLFSIADIATGTGIWLEDVSHVLECNAPSASPRYYHGFDISAAQFPEKRKGQSKINFSVQDISKPFPREHMNRYDLVHVRLLVAGLQESDYAPALANLYSLLKPGGYLQWEEIDSRSYSTDEALTNPAIQRVHNIFISGFKITGMCYDASDKVYGQSLAVGFHNVLLEVYSSAPKRDLHADARNWLAALIGTLVPRLMVQSGQVADLESAMERLKVLMDDLREQWANGALPMVKISMIVGQKI